MKGFIVFLGALILLSGMSYAECCKEVNCENVANNYKPQNVVMTKDEPIKISEDRKSLIYLAKVNGKYFYQATRHASVYQGGKNGDKSILTSLANQNDFYKALKEIGLKPGNNMSLKNKEVTHVAGDELDINVTWDGAAREYNLDEVIIDSNNLPLVMKFGGNEERAKKKNTGCLICLDSCPVGVVSNAVYTYGSVEKRSEVAFKGNKNVLPKDGTIVKIIVRKKQ